MDTPREPAFDSVVFTLAQVLRVPFAYINLVAQDRVWPKAAVGPRVIDWARVTTFCSLVIAQRDMMAIEDMQVDPRFTSEPPQDQVPVLRFAAGIPIYGPNDQCVGALCAFDRRRQIISVRQTFNLALLARQTSELLQMRVPGSRTRL